MSSSQSQEPKIASYNRPHKQETMTIPARAGMSNQRRDSTRDQGPRINKHLSKLRTATTCTPNNTCRGREIHGIKPEVTSQRGKSNAGQRGKSNAGQYEKLQASSIKSNQLLQYSNKQEDKAFGERASPKQSSIPSNTRVVNLPHIITRRPNRHHNVNLIDTRTVSIQHSPLRS
jgi:hypothetical protein